MLIHWFWEYDDIINKCSRKSLEFPQYPIHLTLYVQRAVFIAHHRDIEMFLPSVWCHSKFFLVGRCHIPLMEKPSSINSWYVFATPDCAYYVSLQWEWIGISGWDFVKCSNVYHYSGFLVWYFFWPNVYCLPYNKDWRPEWGWSLSSVHLFLLMEPVKFFVNNCSVFGSQRIRPLRYLCVIPAFFERYG